MLQLQIPQLLSDAIDNSLGKHPTVPLHFYVYWILVLGRVGAVAGYFSRTSLFKVAYDIEFDLRNRIYEHLTRMSFPLLRPGAVGPADLAGQLGHPLRADVPRPSRH